MGIFALANRLAADGLLSPVETAWLRAGNDWYEAAYDEPTKFMPDVFNRDAHPVTECWFKASATSLLANIDGYLRLLDAHGVPWERVESDAPGTVLYEDSVQIVVAPDPLELRDVPTHPER